eukprot:CAMPEP_0185014646 /NCGR_PEP_ID=MMETSP1098-20130426/99424_1 /TAXON_ID=89044 /ORGANISM="Spumella elongata, Strain CCAP 955/1" /LENGTH=627 /DNA_ID=CAMNT_0027543743 /DNA_START=39 /DNA_END=1922 /DNA_ORIENTATION=-
MQKKLVNSPSRCVEEAIEGVLFSDSNLQRVEGLNILIRKDIAEHKANFVSVISGGGSGHEPAHAGFIGEGMLSGAVLGNVFASPSVASILAAIRIVAGPKGVLIIVKNYTGDRLNFGMAAETAKQEGIDVKLVIVADDCALPLGKGITGGRGLAGTVYVHKVAGAVAASGASLDEVHTAATLATARIGTLGLALSTCSVPGTPASTRLSLPGLIEVGMGIHGEPGREQMQLPETNAADRTASILVAGILDQPQSSASEAQVDLTANAADRTASILVAGILDQPQSSASEAQVDLTARRLSYVTGQRVAVMLNNLGALPVIEMQIVTRGVMLELAARGLVPVRAHVGALMTSLEMAGLSLTLYMVESDDDLAYLDAPTAAPAWIKSSVLSAESSDLVGNRTISYSAADYEKTVSATVQGLRADRKILTAIAAVCHRLVAMEPELTQYDAICGDGDCGMVMKKGAAYTLQDLKTYSQDNTTIDLSSLFTRLATGLSASMGGTSGVLLELCFRAMALSFASAAAVRGVRDATLVDWTAALRAGVDAISYYGGASAGMRTMLDAFLPAVQALEQGNDLSTVAAAAQAGADSTKSMQSLAGRSNYVNQAHMEGTPDPGAVAVAAAFHPMSEC